MKKIFVLICLSQLLCTVSLFPQSQFQFFISHVNALPDSNSKSAAIDSFIIYARTQGIPFTESNTANYFLRGPYNTVEITGDFNEFSPYLDLTKLPGTDFFYYSDQYELNARLDYEFRVNGSIILNDPENPDSILGYYGYHSELAMTGYIQPWEIEYNPVILRGTTIETSIFSTSVNRTYQLKIYLPPSYNTTTDSFPTVYFQDGSSYTDWGNTINVLDNLIASDKIDPIVAVFVIPNDRSQEYAFGLRNLYRQFFVNELVPFIDNTYRTINLAAKRLVIGDSYGGNISALISYNHPDVFGNCALQSAALHPNNYEVYNLLVSGEVKNINFSTVWGSYDDRDSYLTELKDTLISKNYQTNWVVLPEGHSWGLWRATVDTILQYFFPPSQVSLNQVTINTNPAGRGFIVDDSTYYSQQVFSWDSGSDHILSTITTQNGGTGTRYVYNNWSDGGTLTHTITILRDSIITANFLTEHYFTLNSNPGGSSTPNNDWVLEGTSVQIMAIPDPGYSFSEWTGSGSGSYNGQLNPVNIIIQNPITQTANFIVTPINAPSNLSAQINQSQLSIELFWQDNSNNEDGFIIERENISGDAYIVIDSLPQNATTFTDSGLSYMTYDYRIKAFNSLTESQYSDTLQLQIPVELTIFNAKIISGKVKLCWETATELNNKGFDIERKDMNNVWKNIGFVEGNGTTTEPKSYNFTDQKLNNNSSVIYYRLKQIDFDGSYNHSDSVTINVKDVTFDFALYQNYPNPFNPSTKICWQSPVDGWQSLKVYDILGNEVATLVNENRPAGFYEYELNLISSITNLSAGKQGPAPASGIYFYQLKSGELIQTRKMILIK